MKIEKKLKFWCSYCMHFSVRAPRMKWSQLFISPFSFYFNFYFHFHFYFYFHFHFLFNSCFYFFVWFSLSSFIKYIYFSFYLFHSLFIWLITYLNLHHNLLVLPLLIHFCFFIFYFFINLSTLCPQFDRINLFLFLISFT